MLGQNPLSNYSRMFCGYPWAFGWCYFGKNIGHSCEAWRITLDLSSTAIYDCLADLRNPSILSSLGLFYLISYSFPQKFKRMLFETPRLSASKSSTSICSTICFASLLWNRRSSQKGLLQSPSNLFRFKIFSFIYGQDFKYICFVFLRCFWPSYPCWDLKLFFLRSTRRWDGSNLPALSLNWRALWSSKRPLS